MPAMKVSGTNRAEMIVSTFMPFDEVGADLIIHLAKAVQTLTAVVDVTAHVLVLLAQKRKVLIGEFIQQLGDIVVVTENSPQLA